MSRVGQIEQLREVAEPFAEDMGLYIYEITLTRGRRLQFKLVIDKCVKQSPRDSVTIQECAGLSRAVDRAIELDELLKGDFVIEVSSPGVERSLKNRRHFDGAVGQAVEVVLKEAIEGEKTYSGTLLSVDQQDIELEVLGRDPLSVPLKQVQRARTVF